MTQAQVHTSRLSSSGLFCACGEFEQVGQGHCGLQKVPLGPYVVRLDPGDHDDCLCGRKGGLGPGEGDRAETGAVGGAGLAPTE